MSKIICTALISLLALQASAQFNIEFHSGHASYSNNDLKNYQSLIANSYVTGGKVLESFPSFWYYGVDIKWNLPDLQLGLSISEGSTGGQVYYADYSGVFREKQMLKYTSVRMLTAARFLFNDNKTSVQFDPRPGLAFGRVTIDRTVNASDGTEFFASKQSFTYKAVNPFFEPTLSISYKFGPVGISVFAGYHLDMTPNAYRQSNGTLLTADGTEVTMNLSGVRAGGSIGFHLGRSREAGYNRFYLGLGAGLDFGGIFGVNAMSMLTEHVGIFGGAGYNLDKVGMNGGVRLYPHKQSSRYRLFFSGMYGYNAVFVVKNAENYNRTFYGTTIGVGFDRKDSRSNFWTLALQVPLRSEDVYSYKTYLRNSSVETQRDFLPVTISVGYRIAVVNNGQNTD